MLDTDLLVLASYIKISSYRLKTFKFLSGVDALTPTEIAKGSGIRVNHISKVLRELKDKGVVFCLNEDVRKGRLYSLTELGRSVLEYLP